MSAAAIAVAGGVGLTAVAQSRAPAASKEILKVATRRVTETQYRHAIADTFGTDILINARFEPEKREQGLLAVGAHELSITASGFEQYYALARSISDQVLDPKRRDGLMPCKPANEKVADDACTRAFVEKYGEALFRRPLTSGEVTARVRTAHAGAEQAQDYYAGLKLALTSLLVAPDFLFRVEIAEPDPSKRGQFRLDGYTKAARLSYLFWDTAPDAELRAAAADGSLHTKAGLQKQIARLQASPRMADGARAFFVDMLQFDAFESVTKDPAIYPKFSQAIADSAREQTLRTLIDLLVTKKRDYRELFSSNDTYINRHLAAVYNVPFPGAEEWAQYTFPKESQRAGILTQVTFLSLFSHPGASSPTKRGMKVHEIFMCEQIPEPPADVDFSKVQALEKGTVRVRLLAHMDNEGCASCHQLMDPPGLALEHFDSLGQLRTQENGETIDVSAELDGMKFTGAAGLSDYMRGNKRIPQCLVRNVFAYGVGRAVEAEDQDYLTGQTKTFAAKGHRYPDLLASIASSPEFFNVRAPAGATPVPAAPPAARIALATQGAAR
jgi:hypothetical protein